jgi:hypothetical protein
MVVVGEARFGMALDGNSETGDLSLTNAHLVHGGGRTSRESGVGVVVEQNSARIMGVHSIATGRGSGDPYFRLLSPSVAVRIHKAHIILAGVYTACEGLRQINRLEV